MDKDTISPFEEVVEEGLVKIIIPRLELYKRPDGVIEPAWMPVFYNPQAVVSRDVTVVYLKTLMRERDFYFLDLLSGTGVRGLRIARECGGLGILNDVDPRAYYYIKRNIELNNLGNRVEAYNNEANVLLNTLVFTGVFLDYIDIDPYGSPVPFIDSVFKPIGKRAYIGVSATDTGPLSCTYPHKALSRYWSKCIKVDFEKEFASRLLISNIVMRASAQEIELKPSLTLIFKHFIRVFFSARRTAMGAYRVLDECLGYIWFCEKTLERGFIRDIGETRDLKCSDNSRPLILGKIWICPLSEHELVSGVLEEASKLNWLNSETLRLLSRIREESSINNPYYRLDKLCSILGVQMPSISRLIEELRKNNIPCSRTHMDPRGIRIRGDYRVLVDIIMNISN